MGGAPKNQSGMGPDPVAGRSVQDSGPVGPPQHDVRALLGEDKEAILLLDGEPYRLRITSKCKLILTK